MPRTGTLLTPQERAWFSAWLAACVEQSGLSKSKIAKAIGDPTSTQLVNRYLRGVIPTLPMLAKIVSALRASPLDALWRAGYFRELLVCVDRLSTDANARKIAIAFAVAAFPRRDLAWSRVSDVFTLGSALSLAKVATGARSLDPFPLAEVDFDQLDAELHPLLGHAADALAFRDVGPRTRRFAAAEYVNAWADQIDFAIAEQTRDTLRSVFAPGDAVKVPTPPPTAPRPSRRTRT